MPTATRRQGVRPPTGTMTSGCRLGRQTDRLSRPRGEAQEGRARREAALPMRRRAVPRSSTAAAWCLRRSHHIISAGSRSIWSSPPMTQVACRSAADLARVCKDGDPRRAVRLVGERWCGAVGGVSEDEPPDAARNIALDGGAVVQTASPSGHSFRAGSKGVSSGAARPSSTSGASRLAVAGASVTPSIPCPVAR